MQSLLESLSPVPSYPYTEVSFLPVTQNNVLEIYFQTVVLMAPPCTSDCLLSRYLSHFSLPRKKKKHFVSLQQWKLLVFK